MSRSLAWHFCLLGVFAGLSSGVQVLCPRSYEFLRCVIVTPVCLPHATFQSSRSNAEAQRRPGATCGHLPCSSAQAAARRWLAETQPEVTVREAPSCPVGRDRPRRPPLASSQEKVLEQQQPHLILFKNRRDTEEARLTSSMDADINVLAFQ